LAEWLSQIENEFERLGDLPLDYQELVTLSEEFAVSIYFHAKSRGDLVFS
jgi:hypothetical protein